MSDLINFDNEYSKWIQEIGHRFKQSQIKAVTKVNEEMLRFYFFIGKGISDREAQNKYGTGFYKRLSNDLNRIMPGLKSFSETNLRYMKYFYELYSNHPQLVDDLPKSIFCIPWSHNRLIIDKCNGDIKKALFFVNKTLENNWSRAVLMNFLDTDLYDREGKAISNFASLLPVPQSDLAQYAVNATNVPIGISEYKLSNLISEKFQHSMPTIEQIERELK